MSARISADELVRRPRDPPQAGTPERAGGINMAFGMRELIIILVIALVIFGAKRLPEIGKALGKAIREFKKSVKEIEGGVEGEKEEKSKKNEG